MLSSIAVSLAVLLLGAIMPGTKAMYYMDDTDPAIVFRGPFIPLNESFEPITWANASECFNKTFTVGQGYDYQQHSMFIPFTGTGISLFVAYNNRLGLNVSITLDNNFTTINWFILDTDYTTPTITTYNATLYDIQNLTDGDHTLNIVLQDYRGNQSDMMFDYAAVTGTRPAAKAASPSSKTGNKIGAGIGGGLGALAVIVALFFIVVFSRRNKTRSKPSNMELDLIDRERGADYKDPNLFQRVAAPFRPGHQRQQSSFSQSSTSPISPVKPTYSKFLGGQQHPWQKLNE